MSDEGQTHYAGDGCRPPHPAIPSDGAATEPERIVVGSALLLPGARQMTGRWLLCIDGHGQYPPLTLDELRDVRDAIDQALAREAGDG